MHAPKASELSILSMAAKVTEHQVDRVTYSSHSKQGAADSAPKTMRVEYHAGLRRFSEWIAFEHVGYAQRIAAEWWQQRSQAPVPTASQHAVAIARNGGLAQTHSIQVQKIAGERFDKIISYELGPRPLQNTLAPAG